jgi:hypothetical protein
MEYVLFYFNFFGAEKRPIRNYLNYEEQRTTKVM